MTTATATRRPPARYGPGADLLGCTVVLDDPDNGRVILRCPGQAQMGCGTAFEVARDDALRSHAKGLSYLCGGCGGGDRPTPGPKPGGGPKAKSATGSLLLAAASAFGSAEFTTWALVLAAWERDPERWGLPGCEHLHPDSNATKVELYKRSKTGFRCYIRRTGQNRWKLTPEGLSAAKKLRAKT